MSYHRKQRKAANNIQRGMGFECPTCTRYMPRGTDVCYNCGDMPAVSAGRSSGGYGRSYKHEDDDNEMVGIFFFFHFLYIAPFVYWLSGSDEPGFLLLLAPINGIILLSCIVSLLHIKKNAGCIATPVRLWVTVFSVLTAINIWKVGMM